MKKSILISLLLTHFCFLASAQWNIYLQGGFSPAIHPGNADLMVNREDPMETFLFNVSVSRSEYFVGLNARRPLNNQFFTEIGAVYTKGVNQYKLSYLLPKGADSYQERTECDHQILFPFGIGAKIDALEFTGGFQVAWTVSHQCGLQAIEGYDEQTNPLQFGWHSGVQFNFDKMIAGIEYRAQFKRMCSGMYVNGQSLELMNMSGRFSFKVQFPL